MKFIADLHIHSHYSRATAKNLNPENLFLWSQKKGISLVGTGDFTHFGWIAELKDKVVESDTGFYRLKPDLAKEIEPEIPQSCRGPVDFILTGEISCIYKRGGKTRKVHNLILMPDFESVEKLNKRLDQIGNIKSDGRPILGLDSRDLLEIVLEASDRAFFIPAHIWTPWFSLFGSKSGFDNIEDCFADLTPYIHALETGLSSDPPMNRLLSALDDYTLVSNSDAHSPAKLGREANLFDCEMGYNSICNAMKTGQGFDGTIEFFPEEGKYHMDGHRKCNVMLEPEETQDLEGLCPSCNKPVTVGVLNRVMELADRKTPKLSKEYLCMIPLSEILSEILSCGPNTKKVQTVYEDLLNNIGSELHILMGAQVEEIEKTGGVLLAKAIKRMREGNVIKQGGYDGEFGVIRLFEEQEKSELVGQTALFKSPVIKKKAKKAVPQKDKSIKEHPGKNQPEINKSQKNRSEKSENLSKKEDLIFNDTPGYKDLRTHKDIILDPLNPEQTEAVLYGKGHLLVNAGPGTGKTMTLTHRIASLLRNGMARSEEILALTFTNKATEEMKERVGKLVPDSGAIKVNTFHRFCLDLLRKEAGKLGLLSGFNICPEQDVPFLVWQVAEESGAGKRQARELLKNLPVMKIKNYEADGELKGLFSEKLISLFYRYQEKLRGLCMLDLDDLESETLRLLKIDHGIATGLAENRPWIFIDEYQDTSPVQVEIIRAIVNKGNVNLCAIGDPDQSIYGFRGADVVNFMGFEKDFTGTKKIELKRNYRSTRLILDSASSLMGRENNLTSWNDLGDKISLAECRTANEEGEMIVEQIEKIMGGITLFSMDSGRVESCEEGKDLSFGDIAVLYRLNSQGDAIEKALSRAGIPLIRSGEKPLIDRYPVNLVWLFLRAVLRPENDYFKTAFLKSIEDRDINGNALFENVDVDSNLSEMMEQAVNLLSLEQKAERELDDLNRFRNIVADYKENPASFNDSLALRRGIDHELLFGDRVALMTLHAAKGLEWPVVFITGCEDRLLPCDLFGDKDDDEEKRLMYVGITRAQKKVVLSHSIKRMINGRSLKMGPSPFLKLLPEDLTAPLERSKWAPKKKAHEQLNLFS